MRRKLAVLTLIIVLTLALIPIPNKAYDAVATCDPSSCSVSFDLVRYDLEILADQGTFVYVSASSTNYGSETNITVRNRYGATHKGYLRFTVPTYNFNVTVEHAEIKLYTLDASAYKMYIRDVLSEWDESTLTWSTQPSIGSYLVGLSPTALGWISVTNAAFESEVERWLEGGYNYGIMLYSAYNTAGDGWAFASDDYAGYEPRLILNYTWPQVTQVNLSLVKVNGELKQHVVFDVYNTTKLNKTDVEVLFDLRDLAGGYYASGVIASYNSTSDLWETLVDVPTDSTNLSLENIRCRALGVEYPTRNESIMIIYNWSKLAPSIVDPRPSSVFYTNNVTVNLSNSLIYDVSVVVQMPNGTSEINVTGLNSITLQLAEGRNWLYLNYTNLLMGEQGQTSQIDVIVDQYLPNAPLVSIPDSGSNLVNVTWTHDGFDVEWFEVKAWRYEPSYWASSVRVPSTDRWQIVQLPRSGLYYIQVVAIDAAQNEAASDVATYNVSAATVSLLSWNLSREDFSFSLNNTVNVSQDVSWNLTLYTIEGTQVDYRQGILSFYPYENKTYTGNWTNNLTSNVYLAQLWLRDANGSESGFIKSFLAIPPFQEEGQIPLTILQSDWSTVPIELGEKVRLKSNLLVTNANNVESPQQSITIQLPTNITVESVRVRNALTGASYTATINSTQGTASFVAPAVAPYSSLSFQLEATSSDAVNLSLTKINGTEGLKVIGDQTYRIYNATITNPVSYQIQIYLEDNETAKWDCPQCSITGSRRSLMLDPLATVTLKLYKLEPQEELNVTERPFSAFLTWAVSTNLGATASFFGMVIAVAAALAVGGRKYE